MLMISLHEFITPSFGGFLVLTNKLMSLLNGLWSPRIFFKFSHVILYPPNHMMFELFILNFSSCSFFPVYALGYPSLYILLGNFSYSRNVINSFNLRKLDYVLLDFGWVFISVLVLTDLFEFSLNIQLFCCLVSIFFVVMGNLVLIISPKLSIRLWRWANWLE